MTRMIAIDDVKPLLNVRNGNTSYDDNIKRIIATVSRLIEVECRQSFAKEERTETHTSRQSYSRTHNLYGDGDADMIVVEEQIIALRASPIDPDAPVAVWYDPQRLFADDTLIAADRWTLDAAPEMSRILLRYPTRYIRSGLRVRYTAGFAEGDDGTLSASLQEQAPDLYQACVEGCLAEWDRLYADRGNDDDSKKRARAPGLPQASLTFLMPYRRVLTGRG